MQVSVESISKLERRMQVQVPAERVTQEIAARLKKLSRTARLNGFRPGKAPLTVIRQQFGVQVHREVIGELLQSSFAEAVTERQLSPAGNPRIEPQSMDEGQDLKYVATFEVFPEVALQPIESLELERITAQVSESDIDAMIERLRKQQLKYSPVERAAAAGDKVTIDFSGTIDGAEFAGGKGANVAIVLGEGRMLPQLEQGLIGAAAGEHRDISVNFPADYRATELAGKLALFSTEIKTVEEPALLESQIRDMQIEAMRRAGAKDVSQAPPREPLVEPARRRVALGLLFNDLIRRENLVVDPKRADARLDEMVGAYGDAAALKRAYQQNPDAMRQVESLALEDQVVDWILEHAKVRQTVSSFKELMNFEA